MDGESLADNRSLAGNKISAAADSMFYLILCGNTPNATRERNLRMQSPLELKPHSLILKSGLKKDELVRDCAAHN